MLEILGHLPYYDKYCMVILSFFQMNRVKAVEKDKDELEEAKNEAVEYLTLENNIVKQKNRMFQKYMYVRLLCWHE